MGLGGRFDTPDFDERTYRYSVKCDREQFNRIEVAARKAGVSVTTFVQQHFETILDEPADEDGFAAGPFARAHGISEAAARMWNAMRNNADSAKVISGAVRDLAEMAKVAAGRGSDCLAEFAGREAGQADRARRQPSPEHLSGNGAMSDRRNLIRDRIYACVEVVDMGYITPCHIWKGPDSGTGRGGGYPRMPLDGQTMAVHKVNWTNENGIIPGKKQLDHRCRVRLCIREDHLEMVTHLENQKRRDLAAGLKPKRKRRRRKAVAK